MDDFLNLDEAGECIADDGFAIPQINDSFSQMQVKAESVDETMGGLFMPGSWPTYTGPAQLDFMDTSGFVLPQVVPPLLVNDQTVMGPPIAAPPARANSTSKAIRASPATTTPFQDFKLEPDTVEPAPKRRASTHKRAASTSTIPSKVSTAAAPVGLDLGFDPTSAKRQDRLMRNRAAALASRERKREHVSRLEGVVANLEKEKAGVQQSFVDAMNEIERLRAKLYAVGLHEPPNVDLLKARASLHAQPHDLEEDDEERKKAAPTGFSPRGALKKDEIIANHIAAEQHLRDVTRQIELTRESSEASTATSSCMSPPSTATSHTSFDDAGGDMSIMVLAFGTALVKSVSAAHLASLTMQDDTKAATKQAVLAHLSKQGFAEGTASPYTSPDVPKSEKQRDWLLVPEHTSRGLQLQLAGGHESCFNLISKAEPGANTNLAAAAAAAAVKGARQPAAMTVLECQVRSARSLAG